MTLKNVLNLDNSPKRLQHFGKAEIGVLTVLHGLLLILQTFTFYYFLRLCLSSNGFHSLYHIVCFQKTE